MARGRSGSPGFQGQRLRQAREALGLTVISLAELVGVTRQMLTMCEAGERTPSPEQLDKVAQHLGMPREFFFSVPPRGSSAPIFYRSLSAATKTARRKAEQKYFWLDEIVSCLDGIVEFPPTSLPSLAMPASPEAITRDAIETAAAALRRHWSLPDGPVVDLIGTAERHGLIVSIFVMESDELDAFSQWREARPRPIVVLNAEKDSAARLRLDAAHEIGHQILHRHMDPALFRKPATLKWAESQAFLFGSAFLMPEDSFLDDVDAVSLDYLRMLKPRWGTSIAAMLYRLIGLKIVDEAEGQRLWRQYAMRGWKREEPLDNELKPDRPQLLASAVQAIGGPAAVPRLLRGTLPLPDRLYEELLGLPAGSIAERPSTPAVQLRADASVLPFRGRGD